MVDQFVIGLATGGQRPLLPAGEAAGFSQALLLAADLIRQDEDSGRVYETFRNRLMFPIRDAGGRVVGFGGRTLGDDRAKYLNTRQNALFDKGAGLYGIYSARDTISERKRAVVVEGYTDCIAAHQAGFQETVATLGTALTDAQIELLRRYSDEVIFLFDSDKAGEAAADRAIRVALPKCMTVRLARLPEGKDPGEFLADGTRVEAFSDVLNEAIDALEFKWLQTAGRFDADRSDAGRRHAVLDFVGVVSEAVVAGAVDAIQRGLLANRVAGLLRIDVEEVHRLFSSQRGKRSAGPASSPQESVVAEHEAARDGEQAGWCQVLEVLLNEPGAWHADWGIPDISSIGNDRDRRIAALVFRLIDQVGEFRLADVLACCHDADDVQRVTDLAQQGGDRGNYEATLSVAMERIVRAKDARLLDHRLRGVMSSGASDPTAQEFETIAEELKGQRHFAPRRMVRRSLDSTSNSAG
jgi:DNA primase